jgi:hypothetical protein
MTNRSYNFPTLALLSLACALFSRSSAIAQDATPLSTPLLRASINDELPLPAWGPFSGSHVGPSCLVNRLLLQQFAFPIVIAQQRQETLVQATRMPDGKIRVHQQAVTLFRRAVGLAPVKADDDDRPLPAPTSRANRRAHITDADRNGLLWHARVSFLPAAVTQRVAQLPDADGKLIPPAPWGAADATVDYFPAFGDTSGDGLLIRIAITNRSEAKQSYYVDLLGGMDTETEDFLRKDLELLPDAQSHNIVIRHPKCAAVFALASGPAHVAPRACRVDASYFDQAANTAGSNIVGETQPAGLLAPSPANPQAVQPAEQQNPIPTNSWGLVRLTNLPVGPGETVTLFFAVGVGKDADSARESAQTLLAIAEDTTSEGKTHMGAYTLAQRAHDDARFNVADEQTSRLMAQALANAPLVNGRRIGVPSRQSSQDRLAPRYEAAQGGMIALAYAQINPELAAAQLNVFMQSRGDPEAAPLTPMPFPPTNLCALWDLSQSVHSLELLTRLYPYARRRYRQLAAAGGRTADAWPCGWPANTPVDLFIPSLAASVATANGPADATTPDYIAYVIRAARLLRALAQQVNRPAAEIQSYTDDIDQAGKILNDRLWRAERGLYTPDKPLNADTVADLLPLIAGSDSLPPDRRAALLKALTDPALFWGPSGIRQVSKASPAYRADDPQRGAIHIGMNWLLWRGLLDLGEVDAANRLAANLLAGYRAAQAAVDGCPEWLNGDTGAPGGVDDFSGDACALIPLYAAYHTPGTVSVGWNIQMLDRRYEAKDGILHLAFRNLEPTQASTLLCALGAPNGRYKLSGSLTGEVMADSNGVIALHSPRDRTTQAVEITPLAGSAR